MASATTVWPSGRWVRWAGGILAVGLALYVLRGALSPIFFSLTLAYLLDPLVDRFERWMPRGVAIAFVLALLGLSGVLFLLLVLPGVLREVADFLSGLPEELAELVRQVEPWLLARGIPVPHSLDEAIAQFELAPAELASHAATPLQAMGRFLLGGTASAMSALASLLVVPVLAFYLLYDFDRMIVAARELIPGRHRAIVVEIAGEIDGMLGQFLRGQLLVMLAMAVLYGIAYSLVGVRLAIPIALVAGLLAFIPYVGSGSALAMALLMCLVDWDGWTKPLLVVLAYGICQALEGFVIIPKVVGDKVGLPAVWVLVALLVGGEIFGFLGVLLAVPVAAIAKIFVVRWLAWYRTSPLYLDGAPETAPSASSAPSAPASAAPTDAASEPAPVADRASSPEPAPAAAPGPDAGPPSHPPPVAAAASPPEASSPEVSLPAPPTPEPPPPADPNTRPSGT